MILSASGWRKVFAPSGNEEDKTIDIGKENTLISALAAEAFVSYLRKATGKASPTIAVARDSRPTGGAIADAVLKALITLKATVHYLSIAAAPEIMAYAKSATDGFIYISASHNPIAHNGFKFGLNNGGVLSREESLALANAFTASCESAGAEEKAAFLLSGADSEKLELSYTISDQYKKEALWAYEDLLRTIVTSSQDTHAQDSIIGLIVEAFKEKPLSIVCDMNGSARARSIDERFFTGCGITFLPFYNDTGHIAHAIIPEGDNLANCANVITDLQFDGDKTALLGYMPDCDGDRGNLVYWHVSEMEARPIPAQEAFALCVMAESTYLEWRKDALPQKSLLWRAESRYGKQAVVANGPTSLRIDEICKILGIDLFRAEVGEANVVNLARKKRDEGYTVRIFGEGSNGGNITYPSSVRDPVATIMAIVKLLAIRDGKNADGSLRKGLFHIWCEKSGQEFRYKDDFTLSDVIDSLPAYTTTGVSEERAILHVKTEDKGKLKEAFKGIFEQEWETHKEEMQAIYGIYGYKAIFTNGIEEKEAGDSWNNGTGGLKILFTDENSAVIGFIWMRPSGTENVFRVMCDIKGSEDSAERSLVRWENSMLKKADEIASK